MEITEEKLSRETVDEFVDRFSSKLTKNSYFSTMFTDRIVDIEKLIERQKTFISRIIKDDPPEEKQGQVEQVRERHSFHTTPERAKIWLDTLESTIDDMKLENQVKNELMIRINSLMDTLIKE